MLTIFTFIWREASPSHKEHDSAQQDLQTMGKVLTRNFCSQTEKKKKGIMSCKVDCKIKRSLISQRVAMVSQWQCLSRRCRALKLKREWHADKWLLSSTVQCLFYHQEDSARIHKENNSIASVQGSQGNASDHTRLAQRASFNKNLPENHTIPHCI